MFKSILTFLAGLLFLTLSAQIPQQAYFDWENGLISSDDVTLSYLAGSDSSVVLIVDTEGNVDTIPRSGLGLNDGEVLDLVRDNIDTSGNQDLQSVFNEGSSSNPNHAIAEANAISIGAQGVGPVTLGEFFLYGEDKLQFRSNGLLRFDVPSEADNRMRFGSSDNGKFESFVVSEVRRIDLVADTIFMSGARKRINSDPQTDSSFVTKSYVDQQGGGGGVTQTEVQSVVDSTNGFVKHFDGEHTAASPWTEGPNQPGTVVTVPFNSFSGTVNQYLPDGVTDFWNNTDTTIISPYVGGSYTAVFRFKAEVDGSSIYPDIWMEESNGDTLDLQELDFYKGMGTEHQFKITFDYYTLQNFVNNGAKLKIVAGDHTLTMWDMNLLIRLNSKP